MKSLSKKLVADKDAIIERLAKAENEINDRVGDVTEAIDNLNNAIERYNEVVGDIEGLRDDVVGDMETYWDDRTEKWQEGENGIAFDAWKSEWENLDTTPVEAVAFFHEVEPELIHADNLEQLANEVDGG